MNLLDKLESLNILGDIVQNLPANSGNNITITKKALSFVPTVEKLALKESALLLTKIEETAESMYPNHEDLDFDLDSNHPTGDLIDGIVYFYFNKKG